MSSYHFSKPWDNGLEEIISLLFWGQVTVSASGRQHKNHQAHRQAKEFKAWGLRRWFRMKRIHINPQVRFRREGLFPPEKEHPNNQNYGNQ